jgi:hypothetical protein
MSSITPVFPLEAFQWFAEAEVLVGYWEIMGRYATHMDRDIKVRGEKWVVDFEMIDDDKKFSDLGYVYRVTNIIDLPPELHNIKLWYFIKKENVQIPLVREEGETEIVTISNDVAALLRTKNLYA